MIRDLKISHIPTGAHDPLGVEAADHVGRQADTGRGVAAHRLEQDIAGGTAAVEQLVGNQKLNILCIGLTNNPLYWLQIFIVVRWL